MQVNFKDYIPTPRFDGQAWKRVQIEEGADSIGPWNLIDTIPLDPIDTDPTEPLARSFTTNNATIAQGWYRVSFLDDFGNVLQTIPIHNIDYLDVPYRPTVDDVGSLVRTRTKDTSGNELGTFTADTRPTQEDVIPLINEATGTLRSRVGDNIPDSLVPEARRLAALRAAMLVEISYFPEQVATGRSPYNQYKDMWVEGFGDEKNKGVLIQAIEEAEDNPDGPLQPDDPGKAQFTFPPASDIARRPW